MITPNNEFCSALCPETWLMAKADDGIARCNCKGDAEWMTKMSKEKVTAAVQLDEITDALGNVVEIKKPKKTNLSNKEKKKAEKLKKARLARGETITDSEDDDWD
jgi:elongation factor 3